MFPPACLLVVGFLRSAWAYGAIVVAAGGNRLRLWLATMFKPVVIVAAAAGGGMDKSRGCKKGKKA